MRILTAMVRDGPWRVRGKSAAGPPWQVRVGAVAGPWRVLHGGSLAGPWQDRAGRSVSVADPWRVRLTYSTYSHTHFLCH